MKIKIIPENDAEKQKFKQKFNADKIEHTGVKEYLIFGNKTDKNDFLDFHEWTGSYRYLLSSLSYFYEVINDHRREESKPSNIEISDPRLLRKNNQINLEIEDENPKMIKRGEVDNPNIIPFNASNFKKPRAIQFNPKEIEIEAVQDIDNFVEEPKKEKEEENFDDGNDIPQPPDASNITKE